MKGFSASAGLAMAVLAYSLAGPARAQESLDAGKSGAQLFASDCALCHKSPQGLAKSGGLLGLSGFLREHYTASRETAGVIAAYLESLGSAPAGRSGAAKRTGKGGDKAKPGETKPDAIKAGEAKSRDGRLRKPADVKTSEPKPGDAKPAEAKSVNPEPAAANSEPKPEGKPETKPETKPDKPEKSD